jgi:hypothetical protein
MKTLLAASLLAFSTQAFASTWTDDDYATMETPIDDRDRKLFEESVFCSSQPKDGREFYKNKDFFAFFVVKPDGQVFRIWGPYSERVSMDYCDE